MEQHANYSPSRLTRILGCPASVGYIDSLELQPGKPSSYAEEGTRLHHLTYKGIMQPDSLKECVEEDRSIVKECLDYIAALRLSKGHDELVSYAETRVSLAPWGLPEVWGTSDYNLIDTRARHLDVIDWKFGQGIIVYAEDNPQLMAYAAGAAGWPNDLESVTVHVFQPLVDHEDSWDIPMGKLRQWVHGTLATGIIKASSLNAEFCPGTETCRWCEAANFCRPRYELVLDAARKLFAAKELLPDRLDAKDIAKLLSMAPIIDKCIKDLVAHAQNEVQHGRPVPGYKLVRGRSNRKWFDEDKAIKWLAKNTPIEELYVSKAVSPAQAEKKFGALKKSPEFSVLVEKPEGKLTLVSEHDKRQAVEGPSDPISVFKKY